LVVLLGVTAPNRTHIVLSISLMICHANKKLIFVEKQGKKRELTRFELSWSMSFRFVVGSQSHHQQELPIYVT
jgi:hypothetical protein